MSNTGRHKDSDNPNANINPKTLPNPNHNPNPIYPNKPNEPYETILTLTDTVGLQCASSDRQISPILQNDQQAALHYPLFGTGTYAFKVLLR